MTPSVDDFWEALDALEELHHEGEITDEEYAARRRDLESGLTAAARPASEKLRSLAWFAAGLVLGVLATILVILIGVRLLHWRLG